MASGLSPGRASRSLRAGAAEAGHALGEWKGKCGRARLGGRGRARSAPGVHAASNPKLRCRFLRRHESQGGRGRRSFNGANYRTSSVS